MARYAVLDFLPDDCKPRKDGRPYQPRLDTLRIIDIIDRILTVHYEHGVRLGSRGVYYQGIGVHWPAGSVRMVERCCKIGRALGLLDWDHFDDKSRFFNEPTTFDDIESWKTACMNAAQRDPWEEQKTVPVVFIEKRQTADIVGPVCDELMVGWMANGGFVGWQALHEMATKKCAPILERGQVPCILYVGDHDPSGLRMDDAIRRRLDEWEFHEVRFRRIALTLKQAFKLPKGCAVPLHESNPNTPWYREMFGGHLDEGWEVDALSVDDIQRVVRREVLRYRNRKVHDRYLKRQQKFAAEARKILYGSA